MTGLERINKTINFEKTDRIPVLPIFGAFAASFGGQNPEEMYSNAAAQADALLKTLERYKPDGIFNLMDLSAEPEALGAIVDARTGHAPVISRHVAKEDLSTAKLQQSILTARVPVFIETVELVKKEVGEQYFAGALISGPITALANTMGIENFVRMLRREKQAVKDMLVDISTAICSLIARYAEVGADGVMLLEPCATSSIMGAKDVEFFLLPELEKAVTAIKEKQMTAMLHICGDCSAAIPILAKSSIDAVSLDAMMDLQAVRAATSHNITVMGNIDVRQLLPFGIKEEVSKAVIKLTRRMGEGGRFILSTGCEMPADTPAENVVGLFVNNS